MVLALLLSSFTADARRALRVEGEFSNTWELAQACVGTSSELPGPIRSDTGVNLSGTVFVGRSDITTAIERCEVAVQFRNEGEDYFNSSDFELEDDFDGDDPNLLSNAAIRKLVGENKDQFSKAIRYSFLNDGFQWLFFTFSNGATLVRFRGIETSSGLIPLDDRTSIVNGSTVYFRGDLWADYNGEFFCFDGPEFRGVWNEQAFLDRDASRSTSLDPLQDCSLNNLPEGLPTQVAAPTPTPPPPRVPSSPRSQEQIERAVKALPAIFSLFMTSPCEGFDEIKPLTLVRNGLYFGDRIATQSVLTVGADGGIETVEERRYFDIYRVSISDAGNYVFVLEHFFGENPLNFRVAAMSLSQGCQERGKILASKVNFFGFNRTSFVVNLQPGDYRLRISSGFPDTVGDYNLLYARVD